MQFFLWEKVIEGENFLDFFKISPVLRLGANFCVPIVLKQTQIEVDDVWMYQNVVVCEDVLILTA